MKIHLITPNNGTTERQADFEENFLFNMIIEGHFEVPELEDYYRRKFDDEAKAYEIQMLTKH